MMLPQEGRAEWKKWWSGTWVMEICHFYRTGLDTPCLTVVVAPRPADPPRQSTPYWVTHFRPFYEEHPLLAFTADDAKEEARCLAETFVARIRSRLEGP